MNTFLTRMNAVFAFALSNLAVMTIVLVLSTMFKVCVDRRFVHLFSHVCILIFQDYSEAPNIKLEVVNKIVKNMPNYSVSRERNDLGFISFNLDADFSKVFDWNVKQLFLYITAEYQTANNDLNQVVLWDHIMLREDDPKLFLRNQHTKYYFWDDGVGLLGNKNVTLSLSMNVIPNAGFLPIHFISKSLQKFAFPSTYDSKDM